VAAVLERAGLATLLLDLLTAAEGTRDELTGELRFDIRLLADRLGIATDWVMRHPPLAALPIGYFGASTGAAAALIAAAERDDLIRAVVSRGGRPDLARPHLPKVRAPTLLIVGGRDPQVIAVNEQAYTLLGGERDMVIVPGATHLFEEPGALDVVARLAAEWFASHLASGAAVAAPAPRI
jgi:pimeloyl-ACP methyl ester carboxylesterase